MIDKLLKDILNVKLANDWKVYNYSLGDSFDLIVNDSPMYQKNEFINIYKGVRFYKSNDSDQIAGIFLAIPSFKGRHVEFLRAIRESYGKPYFEHVKMEDRILYYKSQNFHVSIPSDKEEDGICIGIGKCGYQIQVFTASDLIDAYFKLRNYTQYVYEINEMEKKSKLKKIEIRVLESLLLAFIGKCGIKNFEFGKFILERDDETTNRVISAIGGVEIYINQKHASSSLISKPSKHQLCKFWDNLFHYYLSNLIYISRSKCFNYIEWKRQDLEDLKIVLPRQDVNYRMINLKSMLSSFIDPYQREYDLKAMIEKFDYPQEDIHWIAVNDY